MNPFLIVNILMLLDHVEFLGLLIPTHTHSDASCHPHIAFYTHLHIHPCHPSVASAYNRWRSTFYLVFDFCEHDLAGLLSNYNVKFSLGEIKKVMQQLLEGLFYIHSSKVRGYEELATCSFFSICFIHSVL